MRDRIIEGFGKQVSANKLAKELGVSRDLVFKVWGEEYGQEAIRERGNRLRAQRKLGTGNNAKDDVRERSYELFEGGVLQKDAAKELGVHPTVIGAWWKERFGLDRIRERGASLKSNSLKGQKREPKVVVCGKCGKISSGHLEPYVCEACATVSLPFKCPACGVGFSTRRGLGLHIGHQKGDGVHDEIQLPKVRRYKARPPIQRKGLKKAVVCTECSVEFQASRFSRQSICSPCREKRKARLPTPKLMDSDLFVQEKTDINEIVDSLGPFPVIQPSSKTQGEFEKLKSQIFYLDEANTIRKYSLRGTVICSSYFPNRYSARYKGMMSVREAWDDPDMLAKAVKVQVKSGDKIDPGSVLKALVMLCKTPSVFRPGVAKFICDRYANKGVVFDPCAGYGGRLFGALASGVIYHGIDINPDTVQGNRELARSLGLESKVILEHSSIEDFAPPSEVADLVFTSPPYYDLERYGYENAYFSAQDWEDRFLRTLVSKAYQVLKSGGVLALNVPAKPVSGYCILDRVMKLALESGFDFLETLYMPIRGVKSGEKVEPIVSFVKVDKNAITRV